MDPQRSLGPSGTVTFLFTDIEGSTGLWERHAREMGDALERHDHLLRSAIEESGGRVFSTAGDSFAAAFPRAEAALVAAVEAQRRLSLEPWPDDTPIKVRMGVCTGEAVERDGDYFGPAVNRSARLMASANGGQILVADSTRQIVTYGSDTDRFGLLNLGDYALKDIATKERIWQVTGEGLLSHFGPPRLPDRGTGNLTLPLTPLVGRINEIATLSSALANDRLITLTGVGGAGKTRLGSETAAVLADEFPDGVWVCELAPIADGEAVIPTVAETLDVRPQPGIPMITALVRQLASARALVVLDNCEHVLAPVARLAEDLLRGCSSIRLLATSREALGVAGESVWPVRPLDPELEAVELFRQRAVAADRTYVVSDEDRGWILELCQRLDGLPLAIELAAARIRTLSPRELTERLEDRFRLLHGPSSNASERHQTLQATIDWSYRLLTAPERTLFDRLSVFSGSFDLHAVEAVCAGEDLEANDVVELLSRLVDQSLVVTERHQGRTRYRLLETLRQYGQAQLPDEHDVDLRKRHNGYCVEIANRANELFTSSGWDRGATMFGREWDNIRSAVDWALAADDVDRATALVEATTWFGALKVRWEHRQWAQRTLDLANQKGSSVPPAVAGILAWWALSDTDLLEQRRLAELGISAAPNPAHPSTNWCWHALTVFHGATGDSDAFQIDCRIWAEASRHRRDRFHQSLLANYKTFWGRPEQAKEGLNDALELAQDNANPAFRVWAEWAKGSSHRVAGRVSEAVDAYRRTLHLARAADHRIMIGSAATYTILALADEGAEINPTEQLHFLDIIERYRVNVDAVLAGQARHLYKRGNPEAAGVLLGYTRPYASVNAAFQPTYAAIQEQADGNQWLTRGEAMTEDQALDYARRVFETLQTH